MNQIFPKVCLLILFPSLSRHLPPDWRRPWTNWKPWPSTQPLARPALAACPSRLRAGPRTSTSAEGDGYVRWGSGQVAFVATGTEDHGHARALHIAAWDPQRAMAVIAMARDILDIHRPVARIGNDLEPSCAGCRIMIVTHAPFMDGQPREVACSSLVAVARMLSVPI